MGLLSQFLAENKAAFLKDVEEKNVEELKKWTVVMGNEAGDLDSVASSVAYSYLETKLHSDRTIALILTQRGDLYLRPENLYALNKLAGLDEASNFKELLCIDDLSEDTIKATKVVLVDHNSLLPAFQNKDNIVVGILDHHADEKHHTDTAAFREISPVGSCASLVARHFKDSWNETVPPEVATLLLSAIYIDTGGLKPHDKAVQIDYDSAAFLTPLSIYGQQSLSGDDGLSLGDLAGDLHDKKADVKGLSTRDLLRRDYKQFDYAGIQVGLSTVPLGLDAWWEKDVEFWEGLDAYVEERGLGVLGVLTTFKAKIKGEKKKGEKKKEKRREIVLLVKPGVVPSEVQARLFDGLKASDVLDLEEKDKSLVKPWGKRHAQIWNQNNTEATRKQVAPLVKALVEGNNSK